MWHVSEFNYDNITELADMTREYYGDIEITDIRYLNWQYLKNPSGSAIVVLAYADDGGQLIGQYIIIPRNVTILGRNKTVTLSLNTLTRTSYQGKGVFTKLADVAFKKCISNNYLFTYGFPNQNSYPGFIKRLNFCTITHVPLLILPMRVKDLINKKANHFCGSLVPRLVYTGFKQKQSNLVNITEIDKSGLSLLEDFWFKVKDKYNIMITRDMDYLRWRYFDIPLRDYKVWVAMDVQKKPLGFIATRVVEVGGIKCGMIVDFLTSSPKGLSPFGLISNAIDYFDKSKCELVGCLMLQHTEEYKMLRQSGFFKCPKVFEPQPFPVIFRKHLQETSDIDYRKEKNWFLTMGDYDAI